MDDPLVISIESFVGVADDPVRIAGVAGVSGCAQKANLSKSSASGGEWSSSGRVRRAAGIQPDPRELAPSLRFQQLPLPSTEGSRMIGSNEEIPMFRMRAILVFFAFASVAYPAFSQTYPTRSITMIVPFSVGGATDTIARIMGERMAKTLGQQVIVENVTGAGGSIAVNKVAHAAPDGYTVGIGHIGTHVIVEAIQPVQFDVLKDLDPVAMICTNPQLLIAKMATPAKNLREFMDYVKANEGKVTAGTGGAGTPAHLSAVYFQQKTSANFQIVHYRGSAPATQDVVAGHIDMNFDQAANSIPQYQAGKVKAFAVTAAKRLAAVPDIPTVDEAGLPGFYMSVWHAVWAPHGTPAAAISKLNAAIVEALADPAVRKRLEDLGQDITPVNEQTAAALGAHHRAEIAKWWPLIKTAGIKSE
jgi:tripartite-type tricarboxylate transporter receptor subunit TctC